MQYLTLSDILVAIILSQKNVTEKNNYQLGPKTQLDDIFFLFILNFNDIPKPKFATGII